MRLRLALASAGGLLAAAGIAMIYLPAALIALGIAVGCGVLLYDDGDDR